MSASESTPRIFVIHENTPWVEPLRREFAAIDAPFSEWFLDRGLVDLTSPPPEGVFYNRMSASSHTRGHRYAPEYTGAVLAWLTRHGRTIVNGERVGVGAPLRVGDELDAGDADAIRGQE
jgi:hypothetical protein